MSEGVSEGSPLTVETRNQKRDGFICGVALDFFCFTQQFDARSLSHSLALSLTLTLLSLTPLTHARARASHTAEPTRSPFVLQQFRQARHAKRKEGVPRIYIGEPPHQAGCVRACVRVEVSRSVLPHNNNDNDNDF